MKLFRKQEGFTLVELMVVVLIIGILVAIAIPVFNSAKKNAQRKSCFANQRTIDGACNSYQAEWGVYPAGGTAGITDLTGGTDPYLKKAPLNPGTTTGYALVGTGANAGIECNGCPTATGDYAHGAY
jgi:prepilin-type N-terminal cleavage/methylation domain-containing protein